MIDPNDAEWGDFYIEEDGTPVVVIYPDRDGYVFSTAPILSVIASATPEDGGGWSLEYPESAADRLACAAAGIRVSN